MLEVLSYFMLVSVGMGVAVNIIIRLDFKADNIE